MYYHIRNLWRIRRFIDQKTCHHAVQALIISRLDYCNGLFSLLSVKDVKRLQGVQNQAARLIFKLGRQTQTFSYLRQLHWLPIARRIDFKLCQYVHKFFTNQTPSYFNNNLSGYTPRRTLRSSDDKTQLFKPRFLFTLVGKRFGIAAPNIWNNLPKSIREIISTPTFKKHLKSYFFNA